MSHGCDIKDCNCIGDWTPMLIITPQYGEDEGDCVELDFRNLYVCSAHKQNLKPEDIMDDDVWSAFYKQLEEEGDEKPEEVKLSLVFKQIDEHDRMLH